MDTIENVEFSICAILWWTTLALMLPGLRKKKRDPAYRALLIAFTCKAISLSLAPPAILRQVDRVIGVPNITILIQHLFGGVAFTASILTLLVFWSYPAARAQRIARTRVLACSAASVTLIIFWMLTTAGATARSTHFLVQNSHSSVGATYLLTYATVMGIGLIEVTRLCWRCARAAQAPWLKRGLRLTAVGCGIYLVHPINRAVSVAAAQSGLNPLQWESVSMVAIGIGTALIVAGLTMPSWGPRLSMLPSRIEDYRTLQKIRPLWLALYDAVPEIALESPQKSLKHNTSYRLYRTVIEIRDGWRAMRPELDPEVAQLADLQGKVDGRTGIELQAFIEAKQLKTAIQSMDAGRKVDINLQHGPAIAYLGEDFDSEKLWLIRVSRAYTTFT